MKKLFVFLLFSLFLISCETPDTSTPVSASGVKQTKVDVEVGSDGLTVEQRQIGERYKVDNEIGAVKHLYVISAYSGEVLIYSTVKGKVTSSRKRLTPTTLGGGADESVSYDNYMVVRINNKRYKTQEVIQDDGTYGSSMEYLYWFDVKGVYHQHYVSGGQIVHVSTQALPVKHITINLSK